MYIKKTFSNKLRLLLVPIANTNTVTVLIMVKVGSKYETIKINGIAHFLEHLFFKGTAKRPAALDISKVFDQVGGEYNAFTSQEYTGFYAKVNHKHFETALEVLSDMLLNSKFDKIELEKERGVIIEEINMYQDNPMEYVSNLWHRVLYGDQPAGWDIAGTKETVKEITREEIVKFYKKYYTPANIVICLSGNLPKNKVINRTVIKYFNHPKINSSANKKISVKISQNQPNIILQYKKTDQTHLLLGVRGYDMFHKDRFSLKLLSIVLGGGMSSRLFNEIRGKRGLAYYIYTQSESDSDTGYLTTGAGLDNSKIIGAITIILQEYKKITTEGITEDELEKAKEYFKGKTTLNLESSDEWANFFGSQELLRREILNLEDIFAKIDKVTVKDIQRVAKDVFNNEKLNLAIIGPFKNKEIFFDILKI